MQYKIYLTFDFDTLIKKQANNNRYHPVKKQRWSTHSGIQPFPCLYNNNHSNRLVEILWDGVFLTNVEWYSKIVFFLLLL